jgi:hypothetical protein
MLGVHPITVSRWERGTAAPTDYNVQQLMMLERGMRRLEEDQRRTFARLVATGLFVGALAFVVVRAVDELLGTGRD